MRATQDSDAKALISEGPQDGQVKEKEDWRKSVGLSEIVDADLQKKSLETLAEYAEIWNVRLGQLKDTKHHMNIRLETVPNHQIPFHLVPEMRAIKAEHVADQLKEGVIEPSKS